jgi:hypothetical protein
MPQFRKGMGSREMVGVRWLPERSNLAQFFLAQRKEIALEFGFKHSMPHVD